MGLFWDFVIGPALAILPMRWRQRLPGGKEAEWTRAGTVSGIYEMLAAIVCLGFWYMFEMTRRIGQVVDLSDRVSGGLEEHQVRGAAFALFWMSPLTWLLFYFFFEGAVRLCAAAFTEQNFGTLPLYLAERVMFWVRKPEEARVGERLREHGSSFSESIRERIMVARLEKVADELKYTKSGEEEFLDLRACRRKEEWVPPRIVRVDGVYFRLEESWMGTGARPFCYRLRRLAAGVPGRSVIVYRSGEEGQ